MLRLIEKLYPLALAPVSKDTDKAVAMLCDELDFHVHEYPSGETYNGWTIPKGWEIIKAELYYEGALIFSGTDNPLSVFGYSQSFKGDLSLDELIPHLSSRPDFPAEVGYHCDFYYKPHIEDWGLSIPYHLFKSLRPGQYHVDIQTEFHDSTMKVLDFYLPGKTSDTIVFNAHNCHAIQANDDLAGVAVGVEVMKTLQKRGDNYFSYRLIIAPEHFGTVFYLANLDKETRETFKYCTFLEMLGNDNRLLLQSTFNGDTWIDAAAKSIIRRTESPEFTNFRESVGNDETVWEAAGYEIPTLSLSRWPFAEYHTTLDTPENINVAKLAEAYHVVMDYIFIMETNTTLTRHFEGLIALSNPKYDLYIPMWDPSKGVDMSETKIEWNKFMNYVPRYFNGELSILEMAERHNLPYREVYQYLKKFEAKGLVSFAPEPVAARAQVHTMQSVKR